MLERKYVPCWVTLLLCVRRDSVVGCFGVVKTGTPRAQFSGGQTRSCASSCVCSGENSSLTHSGKERLCVVWTAGRNLTVLLGEGRRFFFYWSWWVPDGGSKKQGSSSSWMKLFSWGLSLDIIVTSLRRFVSPKLWWKLRPKALSFSYSYYIVLMNRLVLHLLWFALDFSAY